MLPRRGFLGGLLAVVFGVVTVLDSRRYGPMTIGRHRLLQSQGVHLRVFHQGRDITNQTFFADDTGDGYADIYLHNARGKPYFNDAHHVAKDRVYGISFRQVTP